MFDRPPSGEEAVVIHILNAAHDATEALREIAALAKTAQARVLETVIVKVAKPTPKFFLGTGKVAEIGAHILQHGVRLALVNCSLSPSQQRNLERAWQCRVVDRVGLILDIFASRAESYEGKLQVELAQLNYMATRLVRGWTHLERQKGGIGLRGPGETQLETDRRLLRARIVMLNRRLEKVRQQRDQTAKARARSRLPVIALVGYTNAGKSSLFNVLTKSAAYVADQLFATLDPSLRRLWLAIGCEVILVDTVGFIQDLPHSLVDAFRATLEETRQANVLLHIIDAANPAHLEQYRQVRAVLAQIDADHLPVIEVYNKVDLLPDQSACIELAEGCVARVYCSASTGLGLDLLKQQLFRFVTELPGNHTPGAPNEQLSSDVAA